MVAARSQGPAPGWTQPRHNGGGWSPVVLNVEKSEMECRVLALDHHPLFVGELPKDRTGMGEPFAVFDALDLCAKERDALLIGDVGIGKHEGGLGGKFDTRGHWVGAQGFLLEEQRDDDSDGQRRSAIKTIEGGLEQFANMLTVLPGGPVSGLSDCPGGAGFGEAIKFGFDILDRP